MVDPNPKTKPGRAAALTPSLVLAAAAIASPTPAAVLAGLPPALARAVGDYDAAQIEGDARALDRLVADDDALVNSHAQVEDKRQMIADYTAPGFHLDAAMSVGRSASRRIFRPRPNHCDPSPC